MSALLQSDPIPTRRPRLYVVPQPHDVTVRPTAAVYRRRRVAAVALVVLFAVTVWAVAQSLAAAVANGAGVTPMQPISATQPETGDGGEYYTVQPGDTLWSIAVATHPKSDIRPVLKRLDDRYGATPLVAGQNILVS